MALDIDAARWCAHLDGILSRFPDLVPVAKGNGYGFSNEFLAEVAARLGVDTLAVGTVDEALRVLDRFEGTVLVLRPHTVGDDVLRLPPRIVLHASTEEAVEDLRGRPVILQCASSLRDGGFSRTEIRGVVGAMDSDRLRGFSLSLPLEREARHRQLSDVAGWIECLLPATFGRIRLYVNHVSRTDLQLLCARYPSVHLRTRVGTSLWLGDPKSFHIAGTVLAVQSVRRGQRFGYRQRLAWSDLEVITVVGGTAHGVGLQAPRMAVGTERLKTVLRAGVAALNRNISPFSWDGRRLLFAEPPHMAVSMLIVPKGIDPPSVGDRVPARLRYTTTRFDRVGIA